MTAPVPVEEVDDMTFASLGKQMRNIEECEEKDKLKDQLKLVIQKAIFDCEKDIRLRKSNEWLYYLIYIDGK